MDIEYINEIDSEPTFDNRSIEADAAILSKTNELNRIKRVRFECERFKYRVEKQPTIKKTRLSFVDLDI